MWRGELAGCWPGLDIGVDSTAGAELAGVQVRRLLEPDDHVTICLPPLFADVSRQVLSESVRSEVRVGAHFLVVVHTEGNDVFVGSQKAIARDRANSFGRLPAQHRLDLLRDDRSAEHSGKGIADGDLEFALDALN